MKIKNKNIIKYLIWLLIFLFLPTMNGCHPSIGYPFSSRINYNPYIDSVTSLIIKFMLNTIIFILIIKFIIRYFEKHKIQLRILSYYAIYEAVISLISLKVTKVASFDLQHIGQLTISWWSNLCVLILTDPDIEKHPILISNASAFVSMLLTTFILFIITIIVEILIIINMKIGEQNKANSP